MTQHARCSLLLRLDAEVLPVGMKMLPRLRSDALEVEVLPRLPTVGVCLPRLLTRGQNPSLSPRLRSKAPWTVLLSLLFWQVAVEGDDVGPLLLEVVVEVVVVALHTTKRNHQAEAVLLEVVVLLWPVKASRQAAKDARIFDERARP